MPELISNDVKKYSSVIFLLWWDVDDNLQFRDVQREAVKDATGSIRNFNLAFSV